MVFSPPPPTPHAEMNIVFVDRQWEEQLIKGLIHWATGGILVIPQWDGVAPP